MAYISESYDDDRILDGLLKIRPEVALGGDNVYIRAVNAEVGPRNGRPTITVTLEFPITPEEWRTVLDAARL